VFKGGDTDVAIIRIGPSMLVLVAAGPDPSSVVNAAAMAVVGTALFALLRPPLKAGVVVPNSGRMHLGIVAMTDKGDGVVPVPQSRAKTAWETTTLEEAVVMACEGEERALRLV
jgi:hypothetical protein